MAAQLTGCAVDTVPGWYSDVATAREMASGPIVAANAVRHPDPAAEAIRWQIAEGELVQIIGRGRGVSRTDANPLDVLVLCDLPLPVPVSLLITASELEPSPVDEMLALGGVALLSARDAAEAYPGLFVSAKAAKHQLDRRGTEVGPKYVLKDTITGLGPTSRARYQRAGPGQRPVEMLFDPLVVPDPHEWLEQKLGPLASFEIVAVNPPVEPGGPVATEPKVHFGLRHHRKQGWPGVYGPWINASVTGFKRSPTATLGAGNSPFASNDGFLLPDS